MSSEDASDPLEASKSDDNLIFDAESDMESAGSDMPEPERTMGQNLRSLVDMGLLPNEVSETERKKRSLSSTGLFKTLIDFVRPGVEGTRINPLKRADHRVICPHCKAILTVPKQAIGRQVLCLECENLIEHTGEPVGEPDAPPAVGAPAIQPLPPPSPADSTPGLQTLDLGEEPPEDEGEAGKKWKDWDKARPTRRGKTGTLPRPGSEAPRPTRKTGRQSDSAEKTRRALTRFREKAGLTEDDSVPFVGRPVARSQPLLSRPGVLFGLVAAVALLAAGVTALVVGGDDPKSKKTSGTSGGSGDDKPVVEPDKAPPPREVDYVGLVPAGEGNVLAGGASAGCKILTRDKIAVWVLLSAEEVASVQKALEDPRAKVCIQGRGVLYSAKDTKAQDMVPPGTEVNHVLADGKAAIEFVSYEVFLHSPAGLK